jgi:hypothetical protein
MSLGSFKSFYDKKVLSEATVAQVKKFLNTVEFDTIHPEAFSVELKQTNVGLGGDPVVQISVSKSDIESKKRGADISKGIKALKDKFGFKSDADNDSYHVYILEGKSDYIIYHNSYSAAIQEVEEFVKKNGFTLDDQTDPEYVGDQMATKVGFGPKKPKAGDTNTFHFDLYKDNKLIKKMLHVQIYNRGTTSNEFELNMYIG